MKNNMENTENKENVQIKQRGGRKKQTSVNIMKLKIINIIVILMVVLNSSQINLQYLC